MEPELPLRQALPSEPDPARERHGRSKAAWATPGGTLQEAIVLMSRSAADIERDEAWVLDDGEHIVGFLRISLAGSEAEIEELRLEPEWIGRGFCRRLSEHGVERARARDARRLIWSPDRCALGFYMAMGGVI